jgi:hypothetical protein
MNPNTSIRPWLLACGKQFGIRQAHDYRWADAEARQYEMYFTYKITGSRPYQVGIEDMSSLTSNTVHFKGVQRWITDVEITLYNSQDGMYELGSCFVGAQSVPSVRAVFNDQCSPPRSPVVTNASVEHDDRIEYIHKMTVQFEEEVEFTIDEANGSVDQIDINMESGDPTYEIDRNGITVT